MLGCQNTGDITCALCHAIVLVDNDVIVFFADDDLLPCPAQPSQDHIIRFRAAASQTGLQHLAVRGNQHDGDGVGEQPLYLHGAVRLDLQNQIVSAGEHSLHLGAKSAVIVAAVDGVFQNLSVGEGFLKIVPGHEIVAEWTNLRIATYTNLEPGTYKFNVVAQNGDEIQSKNVAQLKIIKKPYFYQRPSFIISVLAIVIGVVILIIKMRFDRLKRQKQETEKMSIEVIQALVGTIDAKDKYTNGHSIRVAQYSKMISKALGDSEEEQKRVYYSALLHDIGKIGIPDTIINKPAALTKEEYDIVKIHPEIGSQILRSITTMKEISVGARWHHEQFDGSGYPDKLKGEDIPKIARIIGVADAYDAMTSNRSYRKYLPQDKVRKEFEENKSSQFDSKMAEIMIKIIDEDTDYLLHE